MSNIIKGCRVMTGLTQSEMADILKISKQSYYMRETGAIPFTDNEKIIFTSLVKKSMPKIELSDIFFNNKLGNDSYKGGD